MPRMSLASKYNHPRGKGQEVIFIATYKLGWISRYSKTFIFKPELPFLEKITKMITKVNFRIFYLNMIFAIFLKMVFWDGFLEIHELTLVIIFVVFSQNGNLAWMKILKFLEIQPINILNPMLLSACNGNDQKWWFGYFRYMLKDQFRIFIGRNKNCSMIIPSDDGYFYTINLGAW